MRPGFPVTGEYRKKDMRPRPRQGMIIIYWLHFRLSRSDSFRFGHACLPTLQCLCQNVRTLAYQPQKLYRLEESWLPRIPKHGRFMHTNQPVQGEWNHAYHRCQGIRKNHACQHCQPEWRQTHIPSFFITYLAQIHHSFPTESHRPKTIFPPPSILTHLPFHQSISQWDQYIIYPRGVKEREKLSWLTIHTHMKSAFTTKRIATLLFFFLFIYFFTPRTIEVSGADRPSEVKWSEVTASLFILSI